MVKVNTNRIINNLTIAHITMSIKHSKIPNSILMILPILIIHQDHNKKSTKTTRIRLNKMTMRQSVRISNKLQSINRIRWYKILMNFKMPVKKIKIKQKMICNLEIIMMLLIELKRIKLPKQIKAKIKKKKVNKNKFFALIIKTSIKIRFKRKNPYNRDRFPLIIKIKASHYKRSNK